MDKKFSKNIWIKPVENGTVNQQNQVPAPAGTDMESSILSVIGAQVRIRFEETVNDIGFLTKISQNDYHSLSISRMGVILEKGAIKEQLNLGNTDLNNQLDTDYVIAFDNVDNKEGLRDVASESDYLFRTIITDVPEGAGFVTLRPYMIYRTRQAGAVDQIMYGKQVMIDVSFGR